MAVASVAGRQAQHAYVTRHHGLSVSAPTSGGGRDSAHGRIITHRISPCAPYHGATLACNWCTGMRDASVPLTARKRIARRCEARKARQALLAAICAALFASTAGLIRSSAACRLGDAKELDGARRSTLPAAFPEALYVDRASSGSNAAVTV